MFIEEVEKGRSCQRKDWVEIIKINSVAIKI